MTRKYPALLAIAVASLAIALVGCTTEQPEATMPFGAWPTATPSSTPEPVPTRTPLPAPEHTIADAIQWLREAGLEVVEVEQVLERGQGPTARVSVDGYDRVWIHEFSLPLAPHEVPQELRFFGLPPTGVAPSAAMDVSFIPPAAPGRGPLATSWLPEAFPNTFLLGNILILVRGMEPDPIQNVYTALWNRRPTIDLAPFGLMPLQRLQQDEVAEHVEEWLASQDGGALFSQAAGAAPARPVAVRAITEHFQIDELPQGRLPHPDSLVWIIHVESDPAAESGPRHAVVLIDHLTHLVAGVTYTVGPPPVDQVPDPPVPAPVEIAAYDGSERRHDTESLYDEVSAIFEWEQHAPPAGMQAWPDPVRLYVVERSDDGGKTWQPLRIAENLRLPDERPREFRFAPHGRVIAKGAAITYWDWEVTDGEEYAYRVYGCTVLGQRTQFSDVVSAVAGVPPDALVLPRSPLTRPPFTPPC